jgi:hypothetical protein
MRFSFAIVALSLLSTVAALPIERPNPTALGLLKRCGLGSWCDLKDKGGEDDSGDIIDDIV